LAGILAFVETGYTSGRCEGLNTKARLAQLPQLPESADPLPTRCGPAARITPSRSRRRAV
jgi:hypothetical protein